MRTTFLAVHDLSPSSQRWFDGLETRFSEDKDIELVPAGLTMPWIARLGLPLRSCGPEASYALVEELPPLQILRTVYRWVARGAEDIGFG